MLNKTIIAGLAAAFLLAGTAQSFASLQIGPSLRASFADTNAFGDYGIGAEEQRQPAASVLLASTHVDLPANPALTLPRTLGNGDYGLFGSVALAIGTLPATKQWQRVSATDFTAQYGAECTTAACNTGISAMLKQAALKAETETPYEAMSLINSSVNNLIRYRADRGDIWATPVETATSGTGDCEDYAIAKMWLLRSIGYTPDQLQLVVLRDTKTRLFHSVLAVHVAGKSYILDNMSPRVLADAMIKNYVPIESFSGSKSFIHGFANQQVETASLGADVAEIQPGS